MGYFFCSLNSDESDGQNIHIFKEKKIDGKRTLEDKSLCRNITKEDVWEDKHYSEDENTTRTYAAKLQNNEEEVCGTCVQHCMEIKKEDKLFSKLVKS